MKPSGKISIALLVILMGLAFFMQAKVVKILSEDQRPVMEEGKLQAIDISDLGDFYDISLDRKRAYSLTYNDQEFRIRKKDLITNKWENMKVDPPFPVNNIRQFVVSGSEGTFILVTEKDGEEIVYEGLMIGSSLQRTLKDYDYSDLPFQEGGKYIVGVKFWKNGPGQEFAVIGTPALADGFMVLNGSERYISSSGYDWHSIYIDRTNYEIRPGNSEHSIEVVVKRMTPKENFENVLAAFPLDFKEIELFNLVDEQHLEVRTKDKYWRIRIN